MEIRIAIAGNPNCGKTTLFNALTGSNQFVGNWPGVTVEKKEGKLKQHDHVTMIDLPGIYSLSPYTLEEVVARNYLIDERPDAILDIVDGTNLERNLYLTTQLTEIGIPVVVAINMMDIVQKTGDRIDMERLANKMGCRVVDISALKGTGIMEAAEAAIEAANETKTIPQHSFSGAVEHALAHIEEAAVHNMPQEQQRWYAIKIFERDEKVLKKLMLPPAVLQHIEDDIQAAERELDDDAESIITNERYVYIASVLQGCYKKKHKGGLSTSDKIDRVVTNRWLALPIFAAVMFLVYYIAVGTVGTWATGWATEGVFGDGWHLFNIGASQYEAKEKEYEASNLIVGEFEAYAKENGIAPEQATNLATMAYLYDGNGNVEEEFLVDYTAYREAKTAQKPDPAEFGIWVPGIPGLVDGLLNAINCADWLKALVLDGIVAGVGAVLGFVPQILVLFLFLAFLEACGYMSRIAFVMDKIFRKFGLSGKSFIPILVGTGCGVPGIMASRTIENVRDRRMTIITTTFIPCGAKLPVIALIAGAMFDGAWWVTPSAYLCGILAVVLSGIMLTKCKLFAGDAAPFVMELPAYHMPTLKNVLRSMWENGWSFIKKATTIILLATVLIWFASNYGWYAGEFGAVDMENSILAAIGSAISWLFIPLGWGHWQGAVASITGLVAKENIVGTFGVLFGGFDAAAGNSWQIWDNMHTIFTPLSAYTFLLFNLLCAPCVAAVGAIRREMNSAKWTLFAIGYQCGFAYVIALIVYQVGMLFSGKGNAAGIVAAGLAIILMLFMLFRPQRTAKRTQSSGIARS